MASKLKMTVEAETAKARAELEKINTSIDKMKTSQEKANKTFDNFLKGGKFLVVAKLAMESIKKIVSVSKELIDVYKVQEQAELKLRNAIRASGREADISAGYMFDLASEYQSLTTYGDEALISAQSLMLAYQNVGQDVFPRALKATMDLSSALGTDLNSSVKKIGQALDNPVRNFGALKEAGIMLDEQKIILLKTLVAENKQWEAQDLILKEIESRYGGLSESIAKTSTGKMTQLVNTIGDIKETMGEELLDNIEPFIDIGRAIAEGILLKIKTEAAISNAEGDTGDENSHEFTDSDIILNGIEEYQKALKMLSDTKGEFAIDFNKIGSADIENYEKMYLEAMRRRTSGRERDSATWLAEYKARTEAEAEALRASKLDSRINNPQSITDERTSISATGMNPTSLETTKNSLGEVIEITKVANEGFDEFLDRLSDSTGGKNSKLTSLQQELEQLEKDMIRIEKTLVPDRKTKGIWNGVKGGNFQAGREASPFSDEQWNKGFNLYEDLIDKQREIKGQVAEITGVSDEWVSIVSYIQANEVLINYNLEDRIGILQNEIDLNKSLLEDKELHNKLSDDEITKLVLVTEQKAAQLKLLQQEKDGLKAAQDYLQENNSLLQSIPEYKIKAIDEQIAYNEELLNAVGLSNDEKETIEAIIKLKKQQKKEAEGGGFGSQTIAVQIKTNMEKPEGWDDFFKKLDNEISALENAFGSTIRSISDMVNSLESAIIDGMRNALEAVDKDLQEKTALYEEKEGDEADLRDEKMTALQEQYDNDAISYEEYMAQKQVVDDVYNGNIAETLQAKTEAENEQARLSEEIRKKEFESNKRNSIATALMNGAMAVMRAFSDLGPIGGGVAAALITGITAAQVATIAGQSFVPALKEGGVATKPTLAMIGDGDEPEIVLPLSKANDFGFGNSSSNQATQIVVKVENNTIYGIDDFGEKAYKAIKSAQRIGKVPQNAF